MSSVTVDSVYAVFYVTKKTTCEHFQVLMFKDPSVGPFKAVQLLRGTLWPCGNSFCDSGSSFLQELETGTNGQTGPVVVVEVWHCIPF